MHNIFDKAKVLLANLFSIPQGPLIVDALLRK